MQQRNSKGQFISTKSSQKTNLVRFFGPRGFLTWKLESDFIIITNPDITESYLYYPEDEKSFRLEALASYTPESLAKRVLAETGFWIEKDYNIVENTFLQDYSVLVPRTWEEVQKIVEEQERLENYKTPTKEVKKQDIEEKSVEKLALDDIKIGSLYYNLVYQVVERVIDIQGRLIYTSYHKMECAPYGVSSFRKATQKEVDNYLEEAEEIKK